MFTNFKGFPSNLPNTNLIGIKEISSLYSVQSFPRWDKRITLQFALVKYSIVGMIALILLSSTISPFSSFTSKLALTTAVFLSSLVSESLGYFFDIESLYHFLKYFTILITKSDI